MIFTEPQPFTDALNSRLARMLMPTELRDRMLRTLPTALKERAFWSATVESGRILDELGGGIDEVLAGHLTRNAERAKLKLLLDRLGAPPLSDARLNLILDTNVQTAEGYGDFMQGQDQDILDLWPAQELVRFNIPKVPRDWPERWTQVGGELVAGHRMIAAKDDEIWDEIGSPDNFDDGLGNPYPPFAFNSGMDVQDISREEAVALGVLDGDERVEPQDRGLNEDLQADFAVRDASLRSMIADVLRGIAHFTPDGVLRYTGEGS
jgi:hypothetical protein